MDEADGMDVVDLVDFVCLKGGLGARGLHFGDWLRKFLDFAMQHWAFLWVCALMAIAGGWDAPVPWKHFF